MQSTQDALLSRGLVALLLAGVLVLSAAGGSATTAPAETAQAADDAAAGFSFETVIEYARAASAKDFEPNHLELTEPFADLDYDAYQAIGFRPERRIWSDAEHGFEVELLPPGMLYEDRVTISLVSGGTDSAIPFDPTLFYFGPDHFPYADGAAPEDLPGDLTYSGFRVLYHINSPDRPEEFLVFQGASYFRAVARHQIYGLSARGLALATGSAEGEEFPLFRHLWIHEPEEAATGLQIHALLESPSVSGAFEFLVHPGAETVMDVRSVLFPRSDLESPGIAPLTSMYYFGPANRRAVDDFRSAVHDSSGLQMVTGTGARLWRPLDNPPTLQISSFADSDPQGFGLAQRERGFAHYEDARARYEQRPSGWVVPSGDWGEGSVVLVEIPTTSEFHDNIAAFWQPAEPLVAGGEYRFDYRLYWSQQPPDEPALARVAATRGGVFVNDPELRSLVVDFDLGGLSYEGLEPRVTASAGTVRGVWLVGLPRDGQLRAAMTFDPEGAELSELSLVLVDAAGTLASETWLSRWLAR
jgi:periplasmic glucans biosynthesis protein